MPFVINAKRKFVLVFVVAEQLALFSSLRALLGTLLEPT